MIVAVNGHETPRLLPMSELSGRPGGLAINSGLAGANANMRSPAAGRGFDTELPLSVSTGFPSFIHDSCACRVGRDRLHAVAQSAIGFVHLAAADLLAVAGFEYEVFAAVFR